MCSSDLDYVAVLRTSTNDTERAAALRYILHFTGDIHQPLHCVSRVTRRWPDGDQGGNKFWINNPIPDTKPDHINLHAYWDDGLYSFPKMGPHYAPPPLAEIVAAAPSIVAEHPPTESGWKAGGPFAFAAWAKESTQLAQSVVYAGIAQYRVPDERYRENGIKLSRQRVAWAGYRLAELLNTLWPEQH